MSSNAAAETLVLPSTLSIRHISGAHELLLRQLEKEDALLLDISDDADIDLSFIQLVEASRLYAKNHGKTVSLTHPAGGNLLQTLRRSGFLSRMDKDSQQFWLHGKDL